jgi:hypothetical protein
MKVRATVAIVLWIAAGLAATTSLGSQAAVPGTQGPAVSRVPKDPAPTSHEALLKRYCIGCHNDRLKTGNLALDTLAAGGAAAPRRSDPRRVRRLARRRARSRRRREP